MRLRVTAFEIALLLGSRACFYDNDNRAIMGYKPNSKHDDTVIMNACLNKRSSAKKHPMGAFRRFAFIPTPWLCTLRGNLKLVIKSSMMFSFVGTLLYQVLRVLVYCTFISHHAHASKLFIHHTLSKVITEVHCLSSLDVSWMLPAGRFLR